MTIYREHGGIILVCERCDEAEFDPESDDFIEAFRTGRENGWRAVTWAGDDGVSKMSTVCPECRAKAKARAEEQNAEAAARKKANYERWNRPLNSSVNS